MAKAKKSVLGRGFEGLIPTGMDVADVASPGEHIKDMTIDKIIANPDQPRKEFDQKTLEELAASITEHGILQPLIVTPRGDSYRIVAGERRYRAAIIAKLTKIPVIIRDHEALEELEIALVENVQRVDLSPLEQAVSIVRLRDQFSMSHSDIAKKLGKAETTISNIIRLLQLPKEAVEALQKNQITEGHARAILALKTDENLQRELLNTIITQKLSVRGAEEFVKTKRTHIEDIHKAEASKKVTNRLSKISKNLDVKAKVQMRKKGGIVSFVYKNDSRLEKLLSQLEK